MNPELYFFNLENQTKKQYEALRAFFYEKLPANVCAKKFGYKLNAFYSLARDFRKQIKTWSPQNEDPFFVSKKPGRKFKDETGRLEEKIISLRKQYLSVPDIKTILDSQNIKVSQRYISLTITKAGFARLPRRGKTVRKEIDNNAKQKIKAPKSEKLPDEEADFVSGNAGILASLPFIREYGIDEIIKKSEYPGTKSIDKTQSILSFLALKLSNVRRYIADDLWCMDRGLGLFAGLTTLPKTAWFSSYSHRVTREMNKSFLQQLHKLWQKYDFLSDTVNLDFTTIPYWGDDSQFENNWSGTRHKALPGMLALLAQDSETGIIDYGNTDIKHKNKNEAVLEFLDFYRENSNSKDNLRYLVFDSKFTIYKNLKRLDDKEILFITIQRRGKNIVDKLNSLPKSDWKKIRVDCANGKKRTLKIYEEKVILSDYGKPIRRIAITGNGKVKPALLITNDFNLSTEKIVRKYSRRWIVEKGISEQLDFYHLNRVSSSMVIKVDFDFTMSILAHNLYRIVAQKLEGFSHQTDRTLYEKFFCNSAMIEIKEKEINVRLKKKRNLPLLLSATNSVSEKNKNIPWLYNRKLLIEAATVS